jgi:DNA repair protein RecO (recombination protein O)
MKFTSGAIREGLEFLEAFVPYHLGKQPRSLKFLRQIREDS